MVNQRAIVVSGTIISETTVFSLDELCCACTVGEELIAALVDEGILDPRGEVPQQWQFPGDSLSRARAALRLQRELEINLAGVALALDLMQELKALRARLTYLERGSRLTGD
jgi:chaperone modulatory protein CbpM